MCTDYLFIPVTNYLVERKWTETILVKKPEDREILELVDEGHAYPGVGTSRCTASPVYRCPYRRYRSSIPRAEYVELLSEGTASMERAVEVDVLELVDPNAMYPEAQCSECTAPPSYRCAHRQYDQSLIVAQGGALYEIGSGLSQSQPLRLVSKMSGQGSDK